MSTNDNDDDKLKSKVETVKVVEEFVYQIGEFRRNRKYYPIIMVKGSQVFIQVSGVCTIVEVFYR